MTSDPVSGAWARYNAVFEEARAKIAATPRFANNPDYRRRLYRNLMQVQAMCYNFAVVPRADRPRAFVHTTYQTDFYTLGMACPDFYYVGLFLDGARRYRITGRLGASCWCAAQVQSRLIGDPSVKTIGDFDFADFQLRADRSFEVVASGEAETGNHLPLAPDSAYNFLWVRRILADWHDDPGELHIELIEDGRSPVDEDEAAFVERLDRAVNLARFLLNGWSVGLHDWYLDFTGGYNRIGFLGGQRLADKDVGSLNAHYAGFVFKLEPDEALIITGEVPEGVYWAFQLGDVWSTSLDYLYRQSDINMARMAVDADGRFRAVVSVEDPGIANWLDPAGNREGIGMMRVFRSPSRPALPELRVVKASDLATVLPPGTLHVTAAERRAALAHREAGIKRMYGQ